MNCQKRSHMRETASSAGAGVRTGGWSSSCWPWLLTLAALLMSGAALADTCRVKYDAGGSNDGSSWASAYTSLQTALHDGSCSEIWVAAGRYLPTTGADPAISFELKPGVALYGGFAGTETSRSARDPKAQPTILSGDIDDNDTNTDGNQIAESHTDIQGRNSYHVLKLDASLHAYGPDTVIDGFIITAGQADGAWPNNYGGGLYCANFGANQPTCSPSLEQVAFSGNRAAAHGGAAFFRPSASTIRHARFQGNHADMDGGALHLFDSDITLESLSFSDNSAGGSGGAIASKESDLSLSNASFHGNSASSGGAISYHKNMSAGTFSIHSATFNSNSAAEGGGAIDYRADPMGMDSVSANWVNLILWGNTAPNHPQIRSWYMFATSVPHIGPSLIQLPLPDNVLYDSPLLSTDPLLGPLGDHGGFAWTQLPAAGSPAIDAGTCVGAPATDARGVPRPLGVSCDLGAAEVSYYTLSYNAGANGAVAGPNPQSVAHGDDGSGVLAVPAGGYHFVVWSDGSTANPRIDTAVTHDITAQANFDINHYTVRFRDWDGHLLKTESVPHGAAATAPADPIRTGYTFSGWDDSFDHVTADFTVWAQYTLNHYTVEFRDWNGALLKSESVAHGGAATAPANPTRPNHSFSGWDKPFGNVTAALTVTAQYAINHYMVEFRDWNGALLKSESVAHGGAATAPADPSRTGYSFSGWDVPFGNVTAALTVTAQYAINHYTVEFRDWNGALLKSESVAHGGAATAPADPIRTGYSFSGWDVPFDNVTAALTVTAQYDANAHVLSFDSHGGSAVADINAHTDESVTLPAAPTRAGYRFAQWNSAADGSGSAYAPGAPFTMPGMDVTLHAIWQVRDVSISKRVSHSLVLMDQAGDYVRFEIEVRNNGEAAMSNVEALDLLPDAYHPIGWSCQGVGGGVCAQTSGIGDIDVFVDLPVGAAARFIVDGWIAPQPVSGLVNTAVVVGEDELDSGNNESSARYQRCSASNVQINPYITSPLPHRCVFVGGFEED